MTQRRLPWLLAVMIGLLVLRWFGPPARAEKDAPDVVAAVDRAASQPVPALVPAEATAVHVASAEPIDIAGNAFAVRVVRQPPPPPEPPRPLVVGFMGPLLPPPAPPPPPPPPPPLQVIGTWDDGVAPGAFLAGTQGTVLARPGTVVLAEYRVTAVTAQHVALMHLTSKQEWRLPVPRPGSNR